MRPGTVHTWRATDLQRSMLLTELRYRERAVFARQWAMEVPHAWSGQVVRSAWFRLLERHDILRSQFTSRASEARLYLLDNGAFDDAFRTEVLGSREGLKDLFAGEYERPFAMDAETPLWRVLYVAGGERNYLCLTLHHLIADKRTMDLLLRELEQLLAGCASPANVQLTAVSRFTDYLAWLERQEPGAAEPGWIEYFSALEEPSLIPEDPSTVLDDDLSSVRFRASPDASLAAAIRDLAAAHGLTTNMVLLGGWALVLSRLLHRDTVCLGVVREGVANTPPEFHNTAGPFIRTVPFVVRIPRDAGPLEFFYEVKKLWKYLYQVEQFPMERLLEGSAIAASGPLFNSVYNFIIQTASERRRLSGDSGCRVILDRRNKALEPTLAVLDGESLRIEIVTPPRYASFCRVAARALPAVLEQLVVRQKILSTVSLCHGDYHSLIRLSRGSDAPLKHRTLAAVVEDALVRFAGNTAVDGPVRETFDDLDRHSRSVAAWLYSQAGEWKQTVAIVLPHDTTCLAVLLAVIRSGGAFICLNPESPVEEQLAVLQRARPKWVVTTGHHRDGLAGPRWKVLELPESLPEAPADFEFAAAAAPNDLAYMVHTSGTTGKPMVVQIEQVSAANLIIQMVSRYALKPGDRRFQRAQPGPDFFIAEVLVTLCGGATLVYAAQEEVLSPEDFFESVRSHRISVTGVPSSYWRELARYCIRQSSTFLPDSLRLIIVGMEALDMELLREWKRVVPSGLEMLNVYGPSETTMVCTVQSLQDGIPDEGILSPIGRPIPNTAVYVLDQAGQPMPAGAVGEICVAGVGVMRGYAGSEASENLYPNPHDDREGYDRLYRTGDFGYFNTAGNLVFVGRRDGQVKIRGYRVELDAVEHELSRAANGVAAVVFTVPRGEVTSLVGVLESPHPLDPTIVKDHLRQRMRGMFIPSIIEVRARFSRLPSGKIDRLSVRQEIEAALASEAPGEPSGPAGRTELDQMIAIWNASFERTDCTKASDFFALGGTSLLAFHLLARVREQLGREPSVAQLFDNPTPASFLAELEEVHPSREESRGCTG